MARIPSPPGRFSTTTGWPQRALSRSASSRAPISTPDPGPSGSKNLTVRCGQLCANAGGVHSINGASRPKASSERRTMASCDLQFADKRDIRTFPSIDRRAISNERRDCAPTTNKVVPSISGADPRHFAAQFMGRRGGKGIGYATPLLSVHSTTFAREHLVHHLSGEPEIGCWIAHFLELWACEVAG